MVTRTRRHIPAGKPRRKTLCEEMANVFVSGVWAPTRVGTEKKMYYNIMFQAERDGE